MSALQAHQPSPTPQAALRRVPKAPKRNPHAPFIGFICSLLGLGLGGAIWLNTVVEGQARELVRLQRQVSALTNQEALLLAEANQLRSPRVLALKATDIGMVPNPNPVYIKLPTGEIVGNQTPVTGNELPGMSGRLG